MKLELLRLRHHVVLDLDEVAEALFLAEAQTPDQRERALLHRVGGRAVRDLWGVHFAREEVDTEAAAQVGLERARFKREKPERVAAERGVLAHGRQLEVVHRDGVPPVLDAGAELDIGQHLRAVDAHADADAGERALALLEHGRGHRLETGDAICRTRRCAGKSERDCECCE